MTPAKKRFAIFSIISLIFLIGLEWIINQSVQLEHIFGWLFLSLFIGALAFLMGNKN